MIEDICFLVLLSCIFSGPAVSGHAFFNVPANLQMTIILILVSTTYILFYLNPHSTHMPFSRTPAPTSAPPPWS